jgi:ATP-dependent DNA helicase RecG
MILAFIKKYRSASRKEIDELILGKLSDALNEDQKRNKVRNLIYAMSKREKTIKNIGTSRQPRWIIAKS